METICCLEQKKIEKITELLPAENTLFQLGEFFKIFSDPSRLKILFALRERELCVNDLISVTMLSQTAVSHQLKTLRQSRLVRSRRIGKHILYSLDDAPIFDVLTSGIDHLNHDS